jgi:hypothetical protein
MPKSRKNGETITENKLLHTFKTGQEHNLHSLSLSPCNENFLAADESSITLWNLERSHQSTAMSLLDLNRNKRGNEELISSASFNKSGHNCLFLYTTSKGMINICDFRERSDFKTRPSL